MSNIEVYQSEIDDGLADSIMLSANAGIKYLTNIQTNISADNIEKMLAKASIVSNPGLFPIDSILATVGQNKNDDVFLPEELYNARETIVDKPIDFDHNPLDIIGHIKAQSLLDADFNIIPNDVSFDKMPDKWHIATAGVIYKTWEDKERQKSIAKLIEEIEDGEWYVSMECFFKGFDYAVANKQTGENFIVPRNKETAFLTKHLRIYGGDGEYQGYSIARILRNIVFNGKGIVKRPGNEASIIFSENSPFTCAKIINSVYDIVESNSNKEIEMAETVIQNELVNELKAAKAALESKVAELQAKLSEADTNASKAALANLETEISKKTEEFKALNDKISGLESVKAELNTKLEEATKRANDAEAKLSTIAAEQVKSSRIASLVDAGLTKEEASAKAEKFANLNDEMFGEIVAMAKLSKPAPKQDENKPEETDAAKAAAIALEAARKTGETVVTGGTSNENEETQQVKAALSDFLGNKLAQYKSNKVTEK